jgi:RimJ/RimL family protein N-acetyltransferase
MSIPNLEGISAMVDQAALRPVSEDALSFLHRLTTDPTVTSEYQWYGYHDPHRHRRSWEENGLLGDDGGTLVVTKDDDRLGLVAWRKIVTSGPAYCWSIGIILAPEARGQGHGTAAQRLLVRYLFAHTLVNRIEAATEVDNLAEQRALEKAGFTREGVLRGVGFRAGRWRDGVLYSILRDEIDFDNEDNDS